MGSRISKARPRHSHADEAMTSAVASSSTLNRTMRQATCLPHMDSSPPFADDLNTSIMTKPTTPPRLEGDTSIDIAMEDEPEDEGPRRLQEASLIVSNTDIHSTQPAVPGSTNETIASPPPPPAPASLIPDIRCIVCDTSHPQNKEGTIFVYPCRGCDCAYCTACLRDMFLGAVKDVSRMPPRCCNRIQIHFVRPYLTEDEAAQFRSKYEEWNTPNPLYCPIPTCSAFIPKRVLREHEKEKAKQRVDSVVGTPKAPLVECPRCCTSICTNCRAVSHSGSECNEMPFGVVDAATAKKLKRWGYKRCPKCGQGVRRMHGCNHMQCRCGADWCWVCTRSMIDCSGGCYESDGESDYETDEGTDDEHEEPDGITAGADSSNTERNGTATAHVTREDAEPTDATVPDSSSGPRRRRRRSENLDRRQYWEDAGLDFGDEPGEEPSDEAWGCPHTFRTLKVGFKKIFEEQHMECNICWRRVDPEIQLPPKMYPYTSREKLVPAIGRGRLRGRPRGVAGRIIPRRQLARSDATLGARRSQSVPSRPIPDLAFNDNLLASNNGDRVVDTYGNMLSSTDWILNPEPPRRASFDFTAEPTLKFDTPDHPCADKTMDSFSFAYECPSCGIVVCSTCKVEAIHRGNITEEE